MTNPTDKNLPESTRQAIEWLVLLRSGEISESETYAFADWLSENALHAQAFAEAEDLFYDAAIAAQTSKIVLETTAQNLQAGLTQSSFALTKPAEKPSKDQWPRSARWLALPLSIAAAWLFAIMLIFPEQSHWFDGLLSDYCTGTGELWDIRLADGSHAMLNTNTALSVDYTASTRRIVLHHGQAQFRVAKDAARPFEVVSGDITVRALGTVFEVYQPNPDNVTVTVEEHSVAFNVPKQASSSKRNQVEIKEGERLQYHVNTHSSQLEKVDIGQSGAWRQRKLFVNDRPLEEILAELDRYRNGRIFLADASLKQMRITGAFSLVHPDETLEKIRAVLALKQTRLGPWWVLLHR
jgi:transmembrane sensor